MGHRAVLCCELILGEPEKKEERSSFEAVLILKRKRRCELSHMLRSDVDVFGRRFIQAAAKSLDLN